MDQMPKVPVEKPVKKKKRQEDFVPTLLQRTRLARQPNPPRRSVSSGRKGQR